MAKSKSSASFIVAPSIFVVHLENGAQFLNDTCVGAVTVILIKFKYRCNKKDYILKFLYYR